MNPAAWKQVEAATKEEWPDSYMKSEIVLELSRVLERTDFYDQAAWQGVELSPELRRLFSARQEDADLASICLLNAMLLRAALPVMMLPVEDWGDGVSLKMLRALKAAGLERVRLRLPRGMPI
jgi:hypothetical protein